MKAGIALGIFLLISAYFAFFLDQDSSRLAGTIFYAGRPFAGLKLFFQGLTRDPMGSFEIYVIAGSALLLWLLLATALFSAFRVPHTAKKWMLLIGSGVISTTYNWFWEVTLLYDLG